MLTYFSSRSVQAGSSVVFLMAVLCLRQLPAQAQKARGDTASKTRKTAAKPVGKSAQAGTKAASASSRGRKPLPSPITWARSADRQFAQTASRDQIGSERGMQYLLDAAYFGFDDVVLLLLNRGANPNGRPDSDDTALLHCLRANNLAMARLLLAKGAKPELANKQGQTPLSYAKETNNAPAVQMLTTPSASP